MREVIAIVAISAAMSIPYTFLDYIMKPLYPTLTMSALVLMLMLLPLMLFSIYGFRAGMLCGFAFSVSLLVSNVVYPLLPYDSVLIGGLAVNPLSAGVASSRLHQKHVFPIYFGLGFAAQLLFRTIFYL